MLKMGEITLLSALNGVIPILPTLLPIAKELLAIIAD